MKENCFAESFTIRSPIMKHLIIPLILSFNAIIPSLIAMEEKEKPTIQIAYVDDLLLFENREKLKTALSTMLFKEGYVHDPAMIDLYKSLRNHIAIVETNQGKKFIKIKKRSKGVNEFLGSYIFKNFAPIIPVEKLILSQNIELTIEPFIPEIKDLFLAISQLEEEDSLVTWDLIYLILNDSLNLSLSTLRYAMGEAKNDEFYFNRLKTKAHDGISGRIETIYGEKKFKLMNVEMGWTELKKCRWKIDGIDYQESLEDFLAQARHDLNPGQSRLLGYSHGNWQENNILINGTNHLGNPYRYAYIALDSAGENDLIEDFVMFLAHTTVYADYLNHVYHPKAFGFDENIQKMIKRSEKLKERDITLNREGDQLIVSGVESFGTSDVRKKVAQMSYEKYLHPLVEEATQLFGTQFSDAVDPHLKASLFLRLFGGADLTKLSARDQVKLISLIYKTLGTKVDNNDHQFSFERFMNAL